MESKRQVATSSNTSYVAGGNLPTFGVMIPKKVGSEQVAQLMTTNPKRPRKSYKNAQCRELRAHIFSRRRIIQGECTSGNSLGKRETVRKVF